MENVKKQKIYAGVVTGLFITGIAFGFFGFVNSFSKETIIVEEPTLQKFKLPYIGDADPGADTSGVLKVVVLNNAFTDSNLNNSWNATAGELAVNNDVFGEGDAEASVGSNIPYSTNFEYAIKVRFYKDDLYLGSTWRVDYCNATFSCVDTDLTPQIIEADMEKFMVNTPDATSDYLFMWFLFDNSDSGFSQCEGCTVSSVTFDVWMYSY